MHSRSAGLQHAGGISSLDPERQHVDRWGDGAALLRTRDKMIARQLDEGVRRIDLQVGATLEGTRSAAGWSCRTSSAAALCTNISTSGRTGVRDTRPRRPSKARSGSAEVHHHEVAMKELAPGRRGGRIRPWAHGPGSPSERLRLSLFGLPLGGTLLAPRHRTAVFPRDHFDFAFASKVMEEVSYRVLRADSGE